MHGLEWVPYALLASLVAVFVCIAYEWHQYTTMLHEIRDPEDFNAHT